MRTNTTLTNKILIDAALMMGCFASTPTTATAQPAAQTNRQYRHIAAGHVSIPVADHVMLLTPDTYGPSATRGTSP